MPKQVTISDPVVTSVLIDAERQVLVVNWARKADNGSIYDSGECTIWKTLPAQESYPDPENPTGPPILIPYPENWGEIPTDGAAQLAGIIQKAQDFINSRTYIT